MDAPQIQQTLTKDGVRIAYYTVGEGSVLVYMPSWPWSHATAEWSRPEWVANYEYFSAFSKVVRFDGRGSGLSQRDAADLSLAGRVLDLEAVIEAVAPGESVSIFAGQSSTHVAMAYAAEHPQRVSHLVLAGCSPKAADLLPPQVQALLPMIGRDLDFYIETLAGLTYGAAAGERTAEAASYMRECVSAEEAAATVRAQLDIDLTDLLPKIKCETLLIAYTGEAYPPPESITSLTWKIANSRFVVVEGTSLHSSEALEETRDFLGAGYEPRHHSAEPTAFRTILFTDLVGHTQMMARLGDVKGREILREHERITRDMLRRFAGSEVKTMGDGFMAAFASVTKAVECAIGLQQAFVEWSRGADEELTVRVGLDAGEPIEEEGDLFGATVIMAARIAAKADGKEILVSEVVRGLCAGKGFLFAERGHFVPKGFEEQVRLFGVSWESYS